MMKKNNISWIEKYLVNTLIFLIVIVLLKSVLAILQYEPAFGATTILKSIADSLIVASLFSVVLFPIYIIMRLLSEKAAVIITSLLFSMLILSEISLTIFTMKSGALMDNEIFLRPFNEIVETVKSGISNLWLMTIAFFAFVIFYCWITYRLTKKISLKSGSIIIASVLILLSSSFIWRLPKMEASSNPNVRNFVTNKTWHVLKSSGSTNPSIHVNVDFNQDIIQEYIKMREDHTSPDEKFPMEFIDNTKDNLSQYFNESEAKPNIVLLIVESLGNEWMGTNNMMAEPIMPFLDSLSKESLYWRNCMSTTLRSFGAVPSLTGSVPCGIRGYQFGNMPETNTLIGILKSNGYETNAFYSGEFYFDCIAEYLISQKIDYMSNFHADFKKDNDKNKGNYWGYHDEFLFDKSIDILEDKKSPMFNMFVTISTHDDIDESNPIFKNAVERTKSIDEETRKTSKVTNNAYKKAITFAYTDDCIRDFFDEYSKRDDFKNTIFVITGDHASGFYTKSDISRYHVPLIIYSPLLKESQQFDNIVTHNDVVPSLVTLLKNKYNLSSPEKISWAGNYLSTEKNKSASEMLFVEYAKGVTKMLSNGYIYVKEEDKTYKINNDMTLTDASDETYHDIIKRKFDVYKYVNDYVYLNNKLTSKNIFEKDNYKTICEYEHSEVIECQTPKNKNWTNFYLMPKTEISGEWNKIKISFSADVSFYDEIEADQYMDLYFCCSGENHNYPDYYTDKIVKFFPVDKIEIGEWYNLKVEKEFFVKDATNLICYIYTYYSKMLDSNKALFKNIKVKVSGV